MERHLPSASGRRGDTIQGPCAWSGSWRSLSCSAHGHLQSPLAVALGTSGPPAARRPAGSRPLPVVSHGDYEEKQEGGSLNRSQKKEVVVQMAAVNVAWGETRRKEHVSRT